MATPPPTMLVVATLNPVEATTPPETTGPHPSAKTGYPSPHPRNGAPHPSPTPGHPHPSPTPGHPHPSPTPGHPHPRPPHPLNPRPNPRPSPRPPRHSLFAFRRLAPETVAKRRTQNKMKAKLLFIFLKVFV